MSTFEKTPQVLSECDTDLTGNGQITQVDVILFKALTLFHSSNTSKTFENYYAELVSSGIVPNIDINFLSDIRISTFDPQNPCFNFSLEENNTETDIEIYDIFVSYLQSQNKTTLSADDVDKFKSYLNEFKTQGTTNKISSTDDIMLPSTENDEIVFFTDGTSVPKIDPDAFSYDESNSEKGILVDSFEDKFLVADSGVKTIHRWDNTNETTKQTGLCKIYEKLNGELSSTHTLHPPLNIIKQRNLKTNALPMGTPATFNGKTIAINGNYVAISWHYADSGVVYIYENANGDYQNIHEIIVDGNFANELPVVELSGTTLFVSNPQNITSPTIKVFEFGNTNNYEITTPTTTINAPLPVKQIGFGSCIKVSSDGTKLYVGNPTQHDTKDWLIDLYNTSETDIHFGAVFVFNKISNWGHSETIWPEDRDNQYNQFTANEVALQFGYSIEFKNNTLFIGSPNSFMVDASRREGAVYAYSFAFNNHTYLNKVLYDDAKWNTTSIQDGAWNFGMSLVATSDASKLYVLHNIPTKGTNVSIYQKNSNSEFIQSDSEFSYDVSSTQVTGVLSISDSNTLVIGSKNLLKLLNG